MAAETFCCGGARVPNLATVREGLRVLVAKESLWEVYGFFNQQVTAASQMGDIDSSVSYPVPAQRDNQEIDMNGDAISAFAALVGQ
jgi:hypothetical protein